MSLLTVRVRYKICDLLFDGLWGMVEIHETFYTGIDDHVITLSVNLFLTRDLTDTIVCYP